MVTIRLTRRGGKNQPFYHVMVTDSRIRQGGAALEQVGYFNPVAKGKERRLDLVGIEVNLGIREHRGELLHAVGSTAPGERGTGLRRTHGRHAQESHEVHPAPAR